MGAKVREWRRRERILAMSERVCWEAGCKGEKVEWY